jgi:glycosyltransferase involved in cell wall biosynthesis
MRSARRLIVSYSSALGGAERLLCDLAPALPGATVLACPPGPLAEAASTAGLQLAELRPRRLEWRTGLADRAGAPLALAGQSRELRALEGRLGPELVVAWSMRAAISCALSLAGRRRRPPLAFQHNDLLPRGPAAAAVRAAAGRADLVSGLSHAVAADLDPRGRLAGRLEVSHPGVDLRRFAASPPAPGRRALVLGAIVGWKRPDLALEAAARVPGLELTVAGGPLDEPGERLLERLRERAARPDLAGRVTFTGALADPRPALEEATVLLHCAPREPFGIALAEALASGRPVVAPAAAGPLEIVTGDCGRLYEPADPAAAAAALDALLGNRTELERMGRSARERAEREFGLDAARERFEAMLARAAALR